MKPITIFLLLALQSFFFLLKAQTTWPEDLVLTPEKSRFKKTSTYAGVMDFIRAIKEKSGHVQVISMGKSPEGKEIPVAILSDPMVTTPGEAKASGKPVVYIQGNIHAGEVEGKEALMMMMRDILLGKKKYLLQNQILLFAPIYNTDSNDKMEKGRRPSQEDSPPEVGLRENSQGLDLNRDGMKMEANETRALFKNIVNEWDPQMFVDLHTTNGTWHAYSLTWAPSYQYAGEPITYDYVNNKMLKEITATVQKKYGLFFGPYGDYDLSSGWPPENFYTYNHHPRYLVNQFSLRNRMAILSEAFAHERFYDRIYSTYSFVNEILSFTNRNAVEIVKVNKNAEASAIKNVIENAGKIKKGVRFKMDTLEKLKHFRTYDYITVQKPDGSKELVRTGNVIELDSINYFARFTPEVESTLPRGYIIPKAFSSIVENLQMHGIKVSRLPKGQSFEGEIFNVTAYHKSTQKFEGHFMAAVDGSFSKAKKKFKKGDYIVDMAQPLSNLIFYLLEPQSDDGLVTWNFFDDYFATQGLNNNGVDYPVFKYYP